MRNLPPIFDAIGVRTGDRDVGVISIRRVAYEQPGLRGSTERDVEVRGAKEERGVAGEDRHIIAGEAPALVGTRLEARIIADLVIEETAVRDDGGICGNGDEREEHQEENEFRAQVEKVTSAFLTQNQVR